MKDLLVDHADAQDGGSYRQCLYGAHDIFFAPDKVAEKKVAAVGLKAEGDLLQDAIGPVCDRYRDKTIQDPNDE